MQIEGLAQYLEETAKRKATVTYAVVAANFGLPFFDGNWKSHPLCTAFGLLDREDANANKPFRTSVVVEKESQTPGHGYFTSLADLKNVHTRNDIQRLEAFAKELKALYALHRIA